MKDTLVERFTRRKESRARRARKVDVARIGRKGEDAESPPSYPKHGGERRANYGGCGVNPVCIMLLPAQVRGA